MSERSAPRPHRVSHPSAQPCPRAPVPSPPRTSRASSSPRARPATTRSPPAAHRWPARRSGCGCRLPAPPSTPDQRPRGWGAKRGRGSVRGGARGGPRVPPPPPGPSDGAARRLRVERGARGATVSVRRRRGVGGVLPPGSAAGTPAAASGVSPWGWGWEESRAGGHSGTQRCPRALPVPAVPTVVARRRRSIPSSSSSSSSA